MKPTRRFCEHCERPFIAIDKRHRFCTRKCITLKVTKKKREEREGKFAFTFSKFGKWCKYCHEFFITDSKKIIFCTILCRNLEKKRKKQIFYNKVCRWCEKPFTTNDKTLEHCSSICKRERHNKGRRKLTQAEYLAKPKYKSMSLGGFHARRRQLDLEHLLDEYKGKPEAIAWIKANAKTLAKEGWRDKDDTILGGAIPKDIDELEQLMFQLETPGCRWVRSWVGN